VEETLFMIKPDAVEAKKVGAILAEVEKADSRSSRCGSRG